MSDRCETCLLVLVGLPGAGKSLLARSICEFDMERLLGCPVTVDHICFDDLYKQPTGAESDFSPEEWKASRAAAFKALETSLSTKPKAGTYHLVIADDTMHYKSMRQECYKLARAERTAYVQLHIDTTLEDALITNRERPANQRLPEEVIRNTASKFEPPLKDPYIKTLQLRFSQEALLLGAFTHIFIRQIWDEWGAAVEPLVDHEALTAAKEAAQQATMNSAKHQADVATRKMIASTLEKLQHLDAGDKADIAKELGAARRELVVDKKFEQGGQLLEDEIESSVKQFESICDAVIAKCL